MIRMFTNTAIAGAAAGLLMAAAPVQAAPYQPYHGWEGVERGAQDDVWQHRRGRGDDGYRYSSGGYSGRGRYAEPVRADTRVWRGRDGRYYCRRHDGTTGLLIGGAVGGLVGHEIAGRGDRTLGVIVGAAGGALLGRAIDRSNSRCR